MLVFGGETNYLTVGWTPLVHIVVLHFDTIKAVKLLFLEALSTAILNIWGLRIEEGAIYLILRRQELHRCRFRSLSWPRRHPTTPKVILIIIILLALPIDGAIPVITIHDVIPYRVMIMRILNAIKLGRLRIKDAVLGPDRRNDFPATPPMLS